MADDKEAKRLVTALYFVRTKGAAYKELASRVRAEKVKTILVWANHFKGPESLIPGVNAVIIHTGAHNADMIANAYESFGNNVEIHFADDAGEFVEHGSQDDSNTEEIVQTDSAVQDEAADTADDKTEVTDGDDVDSRSDEKFFEDSESEDEESA